MTTLNEGELFFQRLNGAYGRVVSRAPELIKEQLVELGELVGKFAPYAGSQIGLDDNDLVQINEAQSGLKYPLISTIDQFNSEKLSNVFCQNFRTTAAMTLNSFNKTDEAGDLVLLEVATKLKEIVQILADNGFVNSPV